jgi:hypothetical protein
MLKSEKIRLIITVICVNVFVLIACGGVTPIPNTVTKTVVPEIITATPTVSISTATTTTTPRPTYSPHEMATLLARTYPTVPAIPNYPTAEAPTLNNLFSDYNFYQTRIDLENLFIGKYTIRQWWLNGDPNSYVPVITISTLNQPQIEVAYDYIKIHYLSGSDLTGNGTPDLVLETAHGQYNGTQIYDLGDTPKLVFNLEGQFQDSFTSEFTPEPSKFIDLDGNGSLEYVIPAFWWDSDLDFCFLPKNLVFEYTPSKGKYVYANPKFYNYSKPTQVTIDSEFKNEQDKLYSYCILASEYAAFGDFSTAKTVLYNNLISKDAIKAENMIHAIFSRLGMDIP